MTSWTRWWTTPPANTDLYVEQFSMGQSQGDNGLESLDMPYLIVAKDKAAVDKWQEIKAEAESDPTALLKKLESGALGDYQVPVHVLQYSRQ